MASRMRTRLAEIEAELAAAIEDAERRLADRITPTLPWNVRPTLLYIFMKFLEVLGRNVCLTTYVERGWNEYFAGFSNAYLVDSYGSDGRRMAGYRWLSMSLIFRASRPMPF